MKLQHLRFLAAVVEHGGVVRAAEALRVSQPAISAGLQALEQELGQPLFERASIGRRLRLRPGAEQFHRRALAILRECNAAKAEFMAAAGEVRRFRLGMLPTIAEADMTTVIGMLQGENPDLRLQIWEGNAGKLAAWLRQGRVDASWTLVEEFEPHADILWREPFVGMVAADHPIALRPRLCLTMDDLRREPFVLRPSCEMVAEAREALAAAGVELQVAVRAEREEVAMRLVSLGVGITIAPRSLARTGVVAVPISGLRLNRSIGLRWADGTPGELREALLNAAAPLCRGDHGDPGAVRAPGVRKLDESGIAPGASA
jgi:DNA-binding transcriptional LysR family regulator